MEAPRQLQDHHDEAHHDLPSEPGPNPIGKACNFCRISHTACGPYHFTAPFAFLCCG
jgi:hypothetical protein